MRTTVELDSDTGRAVGQLRRQRGIGVSEAVNELIRRGLMQRGPTTSFKQRTAKLGLRIDVSNVADALETLDGVHGR
ncbi:MAG: CopG family transcriptional regulator [Acidimicrobiales bacterium]